jgi:hypothetical protein
MKALKTGISLHMGPARGPGRGLNYRGLWETDKTELWKRTSVPMGAMRGEPGERTTLLGPGEYIVSIALETDISLHKGPTGEPGGEVRLLRNSRHCTTGLSKRSVSLSLWGSAWGI